MAAHGFASSITENKPGGGLSRLAAGIQLGLGVVGLWFSTLPIRENPQKRENEGNTRSENRLRNTAGKGNANDEEAPVPDKPHDEAKGLPGA